MEKIEPVTDENSSLEDPKDESTVAEGKVMLLWGGKEVSLKFRFEFKKFF